MEWLFSFLAIVLVIAILRATWEGFQIGLGKGLEWLMRKMGFAGSGHAVMCTEDKVGTVLEPFIHNHEGNVRKGKVLYHGEIWHAYCDSELADDLKKDDRVEVIRNKDLSVNVNRKLAD